MRKEVLRFYTYIKESSQAFLAISLGVFLFILFFQPFLLESLDFNNKLIFIAGLGAIIFFITTLVSTVFYLIKSRMEISEFLIGFSILALSSVAFAFYLRYVGKEDITFYTMFKVSLICLIPPLVLRINHVIKDLKKQNETILSEKRELQQLLEKFETQNLYATIGFSSENASEIISLTVSEIVLVKSADNYVEIVYQESAGNFKKKLLRNTLKNVEAQLKPFPNFVRCHRICIVNTLYIEKIQKDYNSHWITIKGFDENLPVSRQYLLKLKELV